MCPNEDKKIPSVPVEDSDLPVNALTNSPSAATVSGYFVTAVDRVCAVAMLALGVIFVYFRMFAAPGVASTVFLVLTLAAATVYLSVKGFRQNRQSLPLLILALVCAGYITVGANTLYQTVNSLLLVAVVAVWLPATTNSCIDGPLSGYSVFEPLNTYIVRPFGNFGSFSAAVKGSKKGRGRFVPVLIGLVLAVPVLVVLCLLLTEADAAFSAVIGRFFAGLDGDIGVLIVKHLLGLAVGFYFFLRAYGAQSGRVFGIKREMAQHFCGALKLVPPLTVYVVLGAVSALYLVYLLSQSVYFFSAFSELLPADFTYAEYARRGFFEICAVAGINMGIIIFARAFTRVSDNARTLSGFCIGISLFTQLLIVTAFSKLVMYIGEYGLTLRRVNAAWFMAVLFVLFVFVIVKCARPQLHFAKAVIVFCLAMFVALCWCDVDRQIARFNISQFESGHHSSLDVDYLLYELSPSAIPVVAEYADRCGEPWAAARLNALSLENYRPGAGGWQGFNLANRAAWQALSKYNYGIKTSIGEP